MRKQVVKHTRGSLLCLWTRRSIGVAQALPIQFWWPRCERFSTFRLRFGLLTDLLKKLVLSRSLGTTLGVTAYQSPFRTITRQILLAGKVYTRLPLRVTRFNDSRFPPSPRTRLLNCRSRERQELAHGFCS